MTRILLIDDDAAFRRMLRLTLEKSGFSITEAGDGRQAVRLQGVEPADVIVTDLIMPEQEGLETILQFRRQYPTVPIIAMSGGGRISAQDFLVVAKTFGATCTFTKPFSTRDLVTALRAIRPATDPTKNAPASASPAEPPTGT